MKTILTLLIVFAAGYISAQIPNNGFEEWEAINGAEEPIGWNTNNISPYGECVERTNDNWLENWAARIRSNRWGLEGYMSGTCQTMFTPTQVYNKISFSAKVLSVFAPAYAEIEIREVLPSGNQPIIGRLEITTPSSTWDYYTVYFDTHNNLYPLIITLSAKTVTNGASYFGYIEWIVDDLQLGFSGVANDQLSENEFKIFPNPADKSFMLSLPEGTNTNEMRIEMYDMSGKMVHSQKISSIITSIDVTDLPAGNYSLAILTKEAIISRKITLK